MKTFSRNSIRVVSVMLVIAAPLFLSNSWKKAAKPTFKERVMEEAEAGKKVAVFTNLSPIGYEHTAALKEVLCKTGEGTVIPGQGATTTFSYKSFWLDENTPAEYDLSSIVAEKLNSGMGTDAFVAVAQDAVATKTITALGIESVVPDWWNSDYNIIVEIGVMARYVTGLNANPLKTSLAVSPLMYVREVVEGKEALGYIVNGRSLGSSTTTAVEHSECYSSLDDLKANVAAPDALVEQCKEGIAEPLAKFIDKENAKYDKAMKKKKK